ncbi:MAG: oligosaccharide flippase family protein [Bacteroidota bacterium]
MKWFTPFWKSLATLVSGKAVGQAITFLALPIMTRMYTAEAFGIAAIFIALSATLSVPLSGGYDFPVMLPQDSSESKALVRLASQIAILLVVLFLVLAIFFGPIWADAQQITWGPLWLWGLPLSLLLEGLMKPLRVYINRLKKYRALALSRLSRSALQAAVGLIWGYFYATFEGIVLGFIIGQFGAFLVLAWVYFPFSLKRTTSSLDFSRKQLLRKYINFPKFAIPTAFLNTASKQLPFFLLPLLFLDGVEVNGLFSQTDRIMLVPIDLVSMSVGSVFFEQASVAWRKGHQDLRTVTYKTFLRLAFLGIFPFAALLFFGPELFAWVLGSEWERSGYFAQWMAPSMYLLFITTPLTFLVDIRQRLKIFLGISGILFVMRLGSLTFGGKWLDSTQTIQVFSIVNIFVILLQLLYLLHLGGVFQKKQLVLRSEAE